MKVRVINKSSNALPEYETLLSAGMDLRANIEVPIVLQPLQRVLVPTGLFIELPTGFEAQIRPRSGLAFKYGVTVLNSPGTIDADYRGEINKSHHPLPAYATEQSAGMDLRANIEEPIVLKPMERRLIPTGLYMALPQGFEAQIRPRSGLAFKKGITVLNSPGTIDSDYRGELMVLLINLSTEEFIVNDGERIAQMVIARHEVAEFRCNYRMAFRTSTDFLRP